MFFQIRKTRDLSRNVALLVKILRAEGKLSSRGKGISELFRLLVHQELDRQSMLGDPGGSLLVPPTRTMSREERMDVAERQLP